MNTGKKHLMQHFFLNQQIFVLFNFQAVCAGAGGGLCAVDSCSSGQSGWAALHLHPIHQHLSSAPSVHHLPHGLLLEKD